jgi:hypothetical protein
VRPRPILIVTKILRDTEMQVAFRAYAVDDIPFFTFGNHYEAKVVIGPKETEHGCIAKYGVVHLYFNKDGQMITEDRHRY